MLKVKEVLVDGVSFFNELLTSYPTLYSSLFDDISSDMLDMSLNVKCGERYASPLLTSYEIDKVVTYCVTRYENSWEKIKDTLLIDYTVINPYNMTTTVSSEKITNNQTTNTNENTVKVTTFDNETGVDQHIDVDEGTLTDSQTYTDETTTNVSGNTGNMMLSALIQSEIELRKQSLLQIVLNDIQSQLTLDIY